MGERPSRAVSRWSIAVKIIGLAGLIIAGNYLTHMITEALDFELRPSNEDAIHRTILIAAILYSVLLAIPFVPGAEIGLALIAMLGPPIAILVYLCTVAGLTISFLLGRLIPLSLLTSSAQKIGLERTTALLKSIEPLSDSQRLEALTEKAPARVLPFVIRHRYLALAASLNTPGNFLIGGGGGIALFAGVSRIFSIPGFLATVVLAVSPVPLLVLLFGHQILGR